MTDKNNDFNKLTIDIIEKLKLNENDIFQISNYINAISPLYDKITYNGLNYDDTIKTNEFKSLLDCLNCIKNYDYIILLHIMTYICNYYDDEILIASFLCNLNNIEKLLLYKTCNDKYYKCHHNIKNELNYFNFPYLFTNFIDYDLSLNIDLFINYCSNPINENEIALFFIFLIENKIYFDSDYLQKQCQLNILNSINLKIICNILKNLYI